MESQPVVLLAPKSPLEKPLKKLGYTVLVAGKPSEVPGILDTHAVDVIFAEGDSWTVHAKAARSRGIPWVELVAKLDNMVVTHATRRGVFRCLAKPLNEETLQLTVADAVESARSGPRLLESIRVALSVDSVPVVAATAALSSRNMTSPKLCCCLMRKFSLRSSRRDLRSTT
jgi:DNA-binding NtrC family response regulator